MTTTSDSPIAARFSAVHRQISECTERKVTVLSVSKRQPVGSLIEAYRAGIRDFGENTVQELAEKARVLEEYGCDEVRWHFIGHLQTNKINKLPKLSLLQSVDRLSLVSALTKRVTEPLPVLVELNPAGESNKTGATLSEASEIVAAVCEAPRLELRGVMGMPPQGEDPEPYFREMAEFHAVILQKNPDASILSMGMSGDYLQAVRCGATMVRLGTHIFGPRPQREHQ